uniref:Long-chain-fatty-acid--CoA ligase n=1 Tax=uncultured bacterium esnapd14 TaxID=1366594 RepID=S5TUN1_9BACT|nr:long-chain-fatty-acid--CoA ligase [uncultured bacterium esnapd14]
MLGVRIEPGEIEALLCEHPAVAHAAVIGWQPDGADKAVGVAALIVARQGRTAPAPGELAPFCRERLPDYLVPMVFASAKTLPLTGNGKLDRRGVAAAIAAHAEVQTPFTAPRTETEEILAGAIGAVLGRERVGIDDNYFAIGGDSIRSVMVASRAQARGVALSVADLHQWPTVRRLAQAVSDHALAAAEPTTEPFSLISEQDRALMPPEVEDAFPLNLLQEGMIFHRDFAAKSAVYHAIASVRLRAPFDLDAMRHVIHELVRRHPMLRTSFDQTTFSRPLQLVHSTFKDPLGIEDLRGRGEAEQQERIEAFVQSEKARGFELDEYPLIRFRVHRLDDETFQFTYGFHHEIVDGWSEALMVTELFGHYLSMVFGEPVAPLPPRSTMRDAVALELEALQRKENYEFWSDYLADATLMRLPRMGAGPKADRGAREIVRIAVPVPPQLSDGLKRLALSRTVPLKSVLLAAHMAVMNRYHGQNDTLTYTVTNGRPETADGSTAIGLFVNSLALRVRMDGGTWDDLILQTLESERRSLPFRRLPMAELKRHQGNEPLAETLFFFTDYHVFRELDRWRERGVEHVASELYGESTFPFCAIFRLNRDTGHLEIRIEYDSLQFSADLMDRVGATYARVLEAIVTDPTQPYHPLELLSEPEEQEIARLGQGTPTRWDVATIHEAFARQAAATPDAVALTSDEGTLTYAALARWAGAIAAQLQAAGAGPDRTVGLLAERSAAAVAAILGILQSGAAYLPLDPGQPDERLGAIVADARPVVLLAQRAHAERVSSVPVQVLTGAPPPKVAKAKVVRMAPDNLAYVIYTSGSTGTPKGVAVTHRNVVNSTLARTVYYPGRPDRYLLLSPLVFDSSVAGLFWPLCTGAALHLPAEGAQLEPGELLDIAQRQQITHTLCVPSLLTALLERERPECLRSVSTLIVAGEASPTELLTTVRRDLPGCTLYNEYGPTENTVWSTVWTGDPPAQRAQLPIGRPIPGTRSYVLNPHLTRVPLGVAAELYLAGAGVARGYLGDPARTADRFLPDPFAPTPGERMYRSGDLAGHDSSGELEFLGRMDKQVKIRGFRVELGEIEGTLDAHPDVHRCVVVARDSGTGEKNLIAFVVARAGTTADGPALQQYLRDRVPKYMVPAAVSVLDELPLTRTGKVDHSALPEVQIGASAGSDMVPPSTETEQVVAAIWCQALERELIGVHDAFFDLGGESLRAMQVVTKANKVFGLDLSVRVLFDTPTVAAFAQLIDNARAASVVDTSG